MLCAKVKVKFFFYLFAESSLDYLSTKSVFLLNHLHSFAFTCIHLGFRLFLDDFAISSHVPRKTARGSWGSWTMGHCRARNGLEWLAFSHLVGGAITLLKNDGVRQLGRMTSHILNGKIIHSCSKPPTSHPFGLHGALFQHCWSQHNGWATFAFLVGGYSRDTLW